MYSQVYIHHRVNTKVSGGLYKYMCEKGYERMRELKHKAEVHRMYSH